jgi:hypothetical protein
MDSTTRKKTQSVKAETSAALVWSRWPLADDGPWSWLFFVALVGFALCVWHLGGGWLLAIAAAVGLAATFWPFFLPVEYEVAALGLRRRVFGRTRLVPWHAIRAYRLRPSGVVLYQRSAPGLFDALRSMFIPYPTDPDDLLVAMRKYASHATELPQ